MAFVFHLFLPTLRCADDIMCFSKNRRQMQHIYTFKFTHAYAHKKSADYVKYKNWIFH